MFLLLLSLQFYIPLALLSCTAENLLVNRNKGQSEMPRTLRGPYMKILIEFRNGLDDLSKPE